MLWKLEVLYLVQNSQSPVLVFSQMNQTQPILILFSNLRLGFRSGLLPSGFPIKALYPHVSPPQVTCPAHLIL